MDKFLGGEIRGVQKQHMEITGQELKLSANETNKLIQSTLPSTIGSTLKEINVSLFPNILYLINVLAVLPVTSCEAREKYINFGSSENLTSLNNEPRAVDWTCMHVYS